MKYGAEENIDPMKDPTEEGNPLKNTEDDDLTHIEESYGFSCPYCGEANSMFVDSSGGRRQEFTTDCEVCCKPIAIAMMMENSEVVEFSAEQESN